MELTVAATAAAATFVDPAPTLFTRNLIVVQGAKMQSSWSWSIMFAPRRLKSPMTRNGTLRMRIVLPMGDSSSNNSRFTVAPITQTRLLERTSSSVKKLPSFRSSQSRVAR
ncbi:MAG: hypothetical protein ABSG53_28195 [Thermoguttaceae bacterium]